MEKKKGFTLVESLISLLIISAVGLSAIYIVNGYLKNAHLRDVSMNSEIGSREEISVSQLHGWKKEFLENSARVFAQTKIEREAKLNTRELADREQALMAKVGQLTIENDWLKKKSAQVLGADWETKSGFKK